MGGGKKYRPEQVVNLLRQIEVVIASGKTTALARKEAGIVEQTYFRWRKGVRWAAGGPCVRLRPTHPDHVWSYDFVSADA